MILWAAIVFPSLAIVEKYLGWPGVAAYVAGAAGVLALANRLLQLIPRRLVVTLACATWVVVTILFLVVYPRVNTHDAYAGSDDDDAHNLGVTALLAGESPYSQTTYLGNQLHQLPGAYVLAAPFVIAGTSALQNLFWLPLFFVTIARATRDPRGALVLAWLVLALSPEVMHQVITGGSYPSNAISVLVCLWWLARSTQPAPQAEPASLRAGPAKWVAAVMWGVALASRANFVLLIPVAFGWLHHRFGLRTALQLIGLTCATVAALSLPFYFNDPAGFGPLQASDRWLRFDAMLPHTGVALVVLTGALAIGLGLMRVDLAGLFRNSAVVLAFPVVAGFLLSSLAAGRLSLEYAPYGLFFSWFALLADRGTKVPRYESRYIDVARNFSSAI